MLSAPGVVRPDSVPKPARLGGRWSSVLLLMFLGGMLLAWVAQKVARSTLEARSLGSNVSLERIDASLVRPEFTPEQVVTKQIESMRAAVLDPDRLRECYSLAAPSNRAVTGPFERFSALVSSAPYDQLGVMNIRWAKR
jgi:hypothetical protein